MLRSALKVLVAVILAAVAAPTPAAVSSPPPAQGDWLPLISNSAGLLLVPVEVNGRRVTALVDTGFPEVVASRRLLASLNVPVTPLGEAVSAGGLQAFGKAAGIQVTIGAHHYPPNEVEVGDFAAVETVLGQTFDLVIGAPILAHAAVEVDLDAGRMRLRPSTRDPAAGMEVPLRYDAAARRFEIAASAKGISIAPVIVDTGADAVLTVSADTFARLPKPAERVTTYLVAGGGGMEVHPIFSSKDLSVGPARLDSLVVESEPPQGYLSRKGAAGLIGMGFLRRYNFVLDGPAARLLLTPRAAARAPVPKSTVGVQGTYRTDRIAILHVMANSPAQRAGLKAGDEICAVDGVKIVNGWSDSPMRNWGTRPPGHTFTISLCSGRPVQLLSSDFY